MSIKDYKIGDELFRYVEVGGVFRYVVIGRREYRDEVQLEVECKTCSHGWQCQLLIAENDFGRIVAVHMLNESDENPQRSWHTNDGFHFCKTAAQAKLEKLKKFLQQREDAVRTAEESLKRAKAALIEAKGMVEGVQP